MVALMLTALLAAPPCNWWANLWKRCPPPEATIASLAGPTTAQAFTVTHSIRWTDDGAGAIDTLVVRDSLPGQPTQQQKLVRPVSPVVVTFTWTPPPIGTTVTGTVRAQTKRRTLFSAWVAKSWTFSQPDVPPPTPTIDSLIGLSIAFQAVSPTMMPPQTPPGEWRMWAALPPGTPTYKICLILTMLDGTRTMRTPDKAGCGFHLDSIRVKTTNPAMQAAADRKCFDLDFDPAMGTVVPPQACDRLIRGTLGWLPARLPSRLAGSGKT